MSESSAAPEAPVVEPAPPMPGEEVTAGEIVQRSNHTPISRATRDLILSDDELRRTWRTAAALAQSGMFKGVAQAEQAFAKILIGRDLGISPTQALMTIDLVEGAIQMRGVLLAGFLRQHPTYDYRLADGHPTQTECTVTIERKRDDRWIDAGSWTFTEDDARKAQLIPEASKAKAAWNAHRKNMLMWRAIANAVRAHAPDLFGGVPVYVDDEIPKPSPLITEGSGDGSAPGVDLGPKVEQILERAAKLGHAGLADRATAEMVLMGQPPGVVERWVTEAAAVLDAIPVDATVVDEPEAEPVVDEPAADAVEAANRAEVLRERAAKALDEADDAKAAGDEEMEAALREQAAGLVTEANALASGEQTDLGI